jgi:hypothetical protein
MPKGVTKTKLDAYIKQWWLTGEEICAHCGSSYAYEVELRCPDCDGPTCPHCMLSYSGRHVCPECAAPDSPGGEP